MENLDYLSLSNNLLDDIGLAPGAFNGMNILRILFLTGNSLTDINAYVFQPLDDLEYLDIR